MNYKICRLCPEVGYQSILNFPKSKKNKDGHDSRCKSCKKKLYLEDRNKYKKLAIQRYYKNKNEILDHKKKFHLKNRDKILSKRRKSWENNPNIKQNRDSYLIKKKEKCYELLGNSCVFCGINNNDVLNIDHINNDGKIDRSNGFSGIKLWNHIINSKNFNIFYQLLCFNCNFKKHLNKSNECLLVNKYKECYTCKNNLDLSFFHKDSSYSDGFYYECKTCKYDRNKLIKMKAMDSIGGISCVFCGIDDIDVLNIDHVNNDGNKRRNIEKTGQILYRKLVNQNFSKKGLQVLCFNCNILKSLNQNNYTVIKSLNQNNYIAIKPQLKVDCGSNDSTFKGYVFKQIKNNDKEAFEFLESNHYAKFGRYPRIMFSVKFDDELIAIVKYCSPIRLSVVHSLNVEYSKVLELDRFCIHPNHHKKNLASFLISKSIIILKRDFCNFKKLISFADPNVGHVGTIYKASNWKCLGKTRNSYEYEDNNNVIIHKKTVYNRACSLNMSEKEYIEIQGLRKRVLMGKIKYSFDL